MLGTHRGQLGRAAASTWFGSADQTGVPQVPIGRLFHQSASFSPLGFAIRNTTRPETGRASIFSVSGKAQARGKLGGMQGTWGSMKATSLARLLTRSAAQG